MDFANVQERLLLTLVQKIEDNTAVVNKLLYRGHPKWMDCEGNVLEGWVAPGGFDEEQEAKWIRKELEESCQVDGNCPCRMHTKTYCDLLRHTMVSPLKKPLRS